MTACNYNCTDLPEHEQVSCGEHLKGGISAIGILECDHVITSFESQSQLQDAIDNNKLTVIKGIKGQVPAPSAVKGENPIGCGAETVLDGYDRQATWKDFNVNDNNVDFYNRLNKRSAYLILFHCNDDSEDNGDITVIQTGVSFEAHKVVPESNKEKQVWNVMAEWSKFDESPMYAAPADIFE